MLFLVFQLIFSMSLQRPSVIFWQKFQKTKRSRWPNHNSLLLHIVRLHGVTLVHFTAQKMKSTIKDFFSKCDKIRGKLSIWSQLLKKLLMEIFSFCAVFVEFFICYHSWPCHMDNFSEQSLMKRIYGSFKCVS